MTPRAVLITLVPMLALLAAPGCSRHGRAKAALAQSGTLEASWSGGRDPSRESEIEFVVVRSKKGELRTYVIEQPDDGPETSSVIGSITAERCMMIKHGRGNHIWPDGPGRFTLVDMSEMDQVFTDCTEYKDTPAWRLVPAALRERGTP